MWKLQEIAAFLEYQASVLPEDNDMHAELVSFTFDKLTVRFFPSRPAALAVAAKFERGYLSWAELQVPEWKEPFTAPKRRLPKRKEQFTALKPHLPKKPVFDRAALNRFISDGEIENAREYAALAGWELPE